jgi:hypothetical protein
MKTLSELIVDQKSRKGKSAGTTRKGAYWLAGEVKIRAYGGDGIGQSGADCSKRLQLRHFRDGDTQAVIRSSSWHQNYGTSTDYASVPALLDCTTAEQVIVILKQTRVRDDENGYADNAYSDHFEDELTAMLSGIGLPESEPAPDEAS